MITSMTGFGRASGSLSTRFAVTVTAKSVNHRFLETSVRLPEYLWEVETTVRAIASEFFSRGKLDIAVRVQRTQTPEYQVRINAPIANNVIPQLRAIAEELGLGGTFSGGDLLRLPDFLQVEPVEADITDEERDALASILREALAQLRSMRAREGETLRADIAARLEAIRGLQKRASAMVTDIRAEMLTTFRDRVNEIAREANVEVREERIAQEVVMLAERADVAEEITRLAHHVEEMAKVIDSKEPAGKKLDFLTQEMLREINTMGSKSRSAALRTVVVELKTEVERIREQVQNVE